MIDKKSLLECPICHQRFNCYTIAFFSMLLPPNKPSMYIPSIKGNRLYIIGLINFVLTNGQDSKIWLEKKGGLKRDYRISIIIDSSKSCFNEIMFSHSLNQL